MTVRTVLAASLALGTLAACETSLQPGDRSPPAIRVTEAAPSLPLVFSTDPDAAAAPTECPDGTRPIEGGAQSVDNIYHILRAGQSRIEMVFSFADPSGIASARVAFGANAAVVHSPDLPVQSLPAHGGGTAEFRVWEFAEAGQLRSPKLFSLEITPGGSPPGTPIAVTARDGAGNERSVAFFVARASAYCR